MPRRMVSLVTPREVAPPLLPAKARQGGEYGSLGICLARSEQGVTAPSGSAAAASPSPAPPPDPARPGLVTRRGAVGPLGQVVAGPASTAPDAALPIAGAAAARPAPVPEPAAVAPAPAPAASAPTVSCNRRAGTVRALTARKAVASATTGPYPRSARNRRPFIAAPLPPFPRRRPRGPV